MDFARGFQQKLAGYLVKGENTGLASPFMGQFTVGSLGAADLASISELLEEYEKNILDIPEDEVIDLTVENAQMEQELNIAKQEALEKSEEIRKSLAKIVFNEEEKKSYQEEVLLERERLAEKLSEARRVKKNFWKKIRN